MANTLKLPHIFLLIALLITLSPANAVLTTEQRQHWHLSAENLKKAMKDLITWIDEFNRHVQLFGLNNAEGLLNNMSQAVVDCDNAMTPVNQIHKSFNEACDKFSQQQKDSGATRNPLGIEPTEITPFSVSSIQIGLFITTNSAETYFPPAQARNMLSTVCPFQQTWNLLYKLFEQYQQNLEQMIQPDSNPGISQSATMKNIQADFNEMRKHLTTLGGTIDKALEAMASVDADY